MQFHDPDWSYVQHRTHEIDLLEKQRLPSCYSNPKSIDTWRHERMYAMVIPLIKLNPDATWMTIGDGNYGSDAYFLQKNGADVLATSLTDYSLAFAKEKGFIDKYEAINAEQIDKPDNTFDFVFCKEAYHHFPRPSIAFYDMLRVARKAVILIEPQETSKRFLGRIKHLIKSIIRQDKTSLFEVSGNFIYRVNITEIEKMMTALNYRVIVIRKFNDFFHPKLSRGKYGRFSFYTLVTKFGIAVQDILCVLKLLDYGLATVVAFKEPPSDSVQKEIKQAGFHIIFLPQNPYLE